MYLHEALEEGGRNPYYVKIRKSWWPRSEDDPTYEGPKWAHYMSWDGMHPDPIGPCWVQRGGPKDSIHPYPMTPVDLISDAWEVYDADT